MPGCCRARTDSRSAAPLADADHHVVDDQLLLLGTRVGREGAEQDAREAQEVRQRQEELDRAFAEVRREGGARGLHRALIPCVVSEAA